MGIPLVEMDSVWLGHVLGVGAASTRWWCTAAALRSVMLGVGIEPVSRRDGVTDAQTMDVVEMVLAGQVNKEIVARIGVAGGRAVRFDGARRRAAACDEARGGADLRELIDLGRVGTVDAVDAIVRTLDARILWWRRSACSGRWSRSTSAPTSWRATAIELQAGAAAC